MKISPRVREFIQVDARGQDIQGTNAYRKKSPRTGRWREITPRACCAALELAYTPGDVTDDTFTLTILCGVSTIATAVVSQDDPTVTIDDVVALLNKKAKPFGKFFVEGSDIHLQLDKTLSLNCADVADLSFTVTP